MTDLSPDLMTAPTKVGHMDNDLTLTELQHLRDACRWAFMYWDDSAETQNDYEATKTHQRIAREYLALWTRVDNIIGARVSPDRHGAQAKVGA